MSDTKISDAAVEAALDALDDNCFKQHEERRSNGVKIVEVKWIDYTRDERLEAIRAAVEAALPHLQGEVVPVFFVEDDFGLWKITDKGNYSFWEKSGNKKVMKLFASSRIENQISVMADEIEGAIEAISDGDAQSAINSLNRVMELVKGVRHE